jgi:uncharacterized membrane protein YhaH (DUF805 family)
MGFGEAISAGFVNYANFRDRASRSEYWYWALFVFLGNLGSAAIEAIRLFTDSELVPSMIGGAFGFVVFVPTVSVAVRRLHDLDRSGWWLLLNFIPLVGAIVLLIWHCTRGTGGSNRFGPDPLAIDTFSTAARAV